MPTIVLFLVIIAIISGFYCYHIIPKQESPDVSSPAAMITTIYPGASPSDIESLVTKKIEEKVEEIFTSTFFVIILPVVIAYEIAIWIIYFIERRKIKKK